VLSRTIFNGGREPSATEVLEGSEAAVRWVQEVIARAVGYRGWWIPRADRDDLCQEALLDLLRVLAGPGFVMRSGMNELARSIGYRRCVDWMRTFRQCDELDPEVPDVQPDPESEQIVRSERSLAWRAVLALRVPCRELIRLHVTGMSHLAIAERQGRTEGAVRTQLSQCIKEARCELGRLQRQVRSRRDTGTLRRTS